MKMHVSTKVSSETARNKNKKSISLTYIDMSVVNARLTEAATIAKLLFSKGKFQEFAKSKNSGELHELYSIAEDVLVYLNVLLGPPANSHMRDAEETERACIHVYAVLCGVYFHENAILNKGLYYYCSECEKEPESLLYRIIFRYRRQLHHPIMFSSLVRAETIDTLISEFLRNYKASFRSGTPLKGVE